MKILHRLMTPYLQEAATKHPVIEILGPRQSGKSTIAQATFH